MLIHSHKSIVVSGLVLAACLATLGGCKGDHDTSATDPVQVAGVTPPSGLTATAGNAMVTLQWTAGTDVTSYHVKRSATSGGPYTQIAAPTAATYIDSSLTDGAMYYYVVSAVNSTGESADSAQASATPTAPSTTATVPANLTATAGNAQASLSWSVSSGADNYHVKRSTTSGGPFTQVGAPTSASYTDTSLTNGTTYYYVVSALDSAGESANSAQVSTTPVAPAAIPATPNGLSAAPGNAQVSLTWSSSSGATSYHVKRATTSGGPFTQVGAPTSASYNDASLTNGTTYYYVVSALDSAGESANSAQVNATPVAPATIPATPTGLSAAPGNAQVTLTWASSSGATSYHVKRATTGGGPFTQVGAPTSTSYEDASLTNGTTYFYVVSALDSAGESANSSQVSALPVVSSPSASACNLASPAFCDTFDEGPTSAPGREGDLDSTKWSVAHLAAADIGEGQVSNPVYPAPIPACKASFSSTSVYPPYDTLICDPSGTRGSQLLTAVASQNYGVNSYMIRQPFDFSGRTGKIDFDVGDDSGYQLVGGFPEINITQNPVAAPTYQQYQNYDTGPVPQNAIIVNFSQGGPCSPTQASPVLVMVYNDYAPTMLPSSNTIGCVNISPGAMNHYEIQLSQNTIEIYGTDYSTDNGQTFTNLHKLYSASISLPFSRGYVHINARNHATIKYGYGPDAIFHWDNIGFDGPVIANTQSYEIPDNTTMESYQGPAGFGTYTVMNLGYQLQDGTAGKPAGIYDPTNILPPLQFKNINTSGATSALLSFNAYLDILQNPADTTWGWKYRFNGGAWMTRTLTSLEVEAINNVFTFDGHGSSGNISMLVNVPIGNLIDGTNTFEMLPLNVPMGYPPVIANIDLTLTH